MSTTDLMVTLADEVRIAEARLEKARAALAKSREEAAAVLVEGWKEHGKSWVSDTRGLPMGFTRGDAVMSAPGCRMDEPPVYLLLRNEQGDTYGLPCLVSRGSLVADSGRVPCLVEVMARRREPF